MTFVTIKRLHMMYVVVLIFELLNNNFRPFNWYESSANAVIYNVTDEIQIIVRENIKSLIWNKQWIKFFRVSLPINKCNLFWQLDKKVIFYILLFILNVLKSRLYIFLTSTKQSYIKYIIKIMYFRN